MHRLEIINNGFLRLASGLSTRILFIKQNEKYFGGVEGVIIYFDEILRQRVQNMLDEIKNIVEESNSEYASPILFVVKSFFS